MDVAVDCRPEAPAAGGIDLAGRFPCDGVRECDQAGGALGALVLRHQIGSYPPLPSYLWLRRSFARARDPRDRIDSESAV